MTDHDEGPQITQRTDDAIRRLEDLVRSGVYPDAVGAISLLSTLDRVAYEFGNDGGTVAGVGLRVIELLLDVLEDTAQRHKN